MKRTTQLYDCFSFLYLFEPLYKCIHIHKYIYIYILVYTNILLLPDFRHDRLSQKSVILVEDWLSFLLSLFFPVFVSWTLIFYTRNKAPRDTSRFLFIISMTTLLHFSITSIDSSVETEFMDERRSVTRFTTSMSIITSSVILNRVLLIHLTPLRLYVCVLISCTDLYYTWNVFLFLGLPKTLVQLLFSYIHTWLFAKPHFIYLKLRLYFIIS